MGTPEDTLSKNSHNYSMKRQEVKCLRCDKIFFNFSLLELHIRVQHEKQKFFCELCDYKTCQETALQDHVILLHTKDFPLKCDLCTEGFLYKKDLNKHKRTSHGLNLLCQFCSKGFENNSDLKQHQSDCEKRAVPCPQCSKLLHKWNLKKHMEIHKGNRQEYVCDICGRNSATLKALRLHQEIHKGEKNYMCEVCGHVFLTNSKLEIHMRGHTKKKPYQCAKCDKAYGHKSVLIVHMRSHTGEKPYMCVICSKQFTSLSGLFYHKRTH